MRMAAEVGDAKTVEQLADKAADIKKAAEMASQDAQFTPEQLRESKAFVERNATWWNQDGVVGESMRSFARSEEARLQSMGVPASELYHKIDVSMKQRYPEVFGHEASSPKHVISPKESAGNSKSAMSIRDIPESARAIFNTIKEYREKRGMKYTVADFIEQNKAALNQINQ